MTQTRPPGSRPEHAHRCRGLLGSEASHIRRSKPVLASLAEVYVLAYTGYDAVMEVADKNNPKLKAYMSDIKAARGEKELAESAYHPKINFEVGPSYSDRSGPGSQWTSGVDAGLVMRWNLFNSGADKAGTEAAESRTRMATETLYNFHDELALEIENTWTRYL
ncbi:MAG: TolC family protein, partial [Bilophila wadsworthia]